MNTQIERTLLQKLFDSPSPLERKKHIFYQLHGRMFPGKDIFRKFLISTDENTKLECAKIIIQRLCFESNFPPPFSLLINLLDFENSNINRSRNRQYIPQDHFSHIVNLYLLGLYFYFYHPEISKSLSSEFIRKRKKKQFNLTVDSSKDFISFWKYFCLFHDITYPIERHYQYKPGINEPVYLTRFNHVIGHLDSELLIESLARYLVVWEILHDDSCNQEFNNIFFQLADASFLHKRTGNIINGAQLLSQFYKYKSIEKIHCYEHFKMLTGLLSGKNYIEVLFHAFSEQPIALKTSSSPPEYYILNNNHVDITHNQIISFLDHDDYLANSSYFIRYYIESLDDLKVEFSLNSFASDDDYRSAIQEITILLHSREAILQPFVQFDQILTSDDLSLHLFQIFQSLFSYYNNWIGEGNYIPSNTSNLMTKTNKENIHNLLVTQFSAFFKEAVLNELPFSDYDKAIDLFNSSISLSTVDNVVDQALETLFDIDKLESYKQEIGNTLKKTFRQSIDEEKSRNSWLIQLLKECSNTIGLHYRNIDNAFLNDTILTKCLCAIIENSSDVKELIQLLQSDYSAKSNNRITCNYSDFIEQYSTKDYRFDHGLYASIIFLLCVSHYYEVIKLLIEKSTSCAKAKYISTLCWNVDYSAYRDKLIEDYKTINYNVLKSVFYHNLYPKSISESFNCQLNNWSYNYHKEPCVYFSMFSDTLQVWNRKKYFYHFDTYLDLFFSVDDYNIIVKNNTILIQIRSTNKNIKRILKRFISDNESYLVGFSTLVSIELQQ